MPKYWLPIKTLKTNTHFTLPDNALNLTALGKGNLKLTGNDYDNSIVGNTGKNKINGADGDDLINGGLGNDVLIGGEGNDTFVFKTKLAKTNVDTIVDFDPSEDAIWLDKAIFKSLGTENGLKTGKLHGSHFNVTNKAQDRSDFIIYDDRKGVILYDRDGSGYAKPVEIAKVSKGLDLSAADFFIV